jgi:maleate cis-trans isomerase
LNTPRARAVIHCAARAVHADIAKICEVDMSFTMWRGVVGMVRPTRRPGATEEIIRMLPKGIGVLPFMVNFRAGTRDEFKKAIPQYEQYVAELAAEKVDLILLSGTPPFMLLGPQGEAKLIKSWEKKYKTPIVTEPQMHVAAMKAMKIRRFIGASYSSLQTEIVLEYLSRCGLKALSMEPIDVPFTKVGEISVETAYAHVKRRYGNSVISRP